MRFVLRRAATAGTLLVAASMTAVVAATVLTALLQYAQLLPDLGTRAAVRTRPMVEHSVLISGNAGDDAADVAARDDEIRRRFGGGLGGLPVAIAAGGYAIGQQLPDGFGHTVPGSRGTYADVAFLDRLPEHAGLLSGTWPRPVPADQPAQVALPERAAAGLGVSVGDRVPIHDRRTVQPAPVLVVGVFRPVDAGDPYWQLAADPVTAGAYGPLVVHRDEFVARYLRGSTLQWVLVPDPVTVASKDLPAVGEAIAHLRNAGIPGPDGAWFPVVRTELDDLAERLRTTRVVSRSGLLLPVLLVLVIAGYVLLLIARLLADQRAGELSLLRARGAGRAQLAGIAGAEALLVVAPAALLGAPLAGGLLRLGERWLGGRGLWVAGVGAGPAVGSPRAWVIAVLAALVCALALVLPAARAGRTWLAEQQQRSRPSRWSMLQRAGADGALVILALLTWVQLRQYAGPLSRAGGALAVDPLLVAAPVIGVVAATALTLRLLPTATRLGLVVSRRRTSFARLLGMWRADRRPHAGPVLLLVLAVATATLASCVAASWQRSQRDQAAQLVGADLRVVLAGGSSTQLSTGDFALPGVRAGTAVTRFGRDAGPDRHEVIGLDAAAAPEIVRLRADLARPDAFALLTAGRPALPGVALPPGTRRLAGHVAYTVAATDLAADPSPLTAILDDGTGTLAEVALGRVPPAGSLDFDVAVPSALPAPSRRPRLLALTASASAQALGTAAFPRRVQWRWTGLRAVDSAGTATAVAIPPRWTAQAGTAGSTDGPPPGELAVSPEAVTLTAEVSRSSQGSSARYVASGLAGLAPAAPVPALATPELLARTGARVGEEIRAASGDEREFRARIVGTVAAVPSSDTDAAMLVDLPTLDAQRLALGGAFDPPTEWWLATDAVQHDRVAAQLAARSELTLADRAAVARRLLTDPLGRGVLVALYVAVFSATALAALGIAVDARATSLRSSAELAVLHTLGTPPRTLAGALLVEQSVLAGLGVLSGLGAGLAVAAAMVPSIVLTERGGRPARPPGRRRRPAAHRGGPMTVMRRVGAHAGPWVLVAVLGLTVVFLLAATPRTVNRIQDRALRRTVADAPYTVRDLLISGAVPSTFQGWPDAQRLLDGVYRSLPAPLPAIVGSRWGAVRSGLLVLDGPDVTRAPSGLRPKVALLHHTGLSGGVRLVEGGPPHNGPGPTSSVDVMVAEPVARNLGLRTGSSYELRSNVGGALPIRVTGLFALLDEASTAWAPYT